MISDIVDVITLLDEDPENQYMLRVEYNTGKKSCINRAVIDKKWKPMTAGIQKKLFPNDQRDKYRTIYTTKL